MRLVRLQVARGSIALRGPGQAVALSAGMLVTGVLLRTRGHLPRQGCAALSRPRAPLENALKRSGIAISVASLTMAVLGPVSAAQATPAPSSAPTSVSTAKTCSTWFVNRNGVNFRTGPGTGYTSIGLLYYPDSGTRVGSTANWVKVRLRYKSQSGLRAGTTAWVAKGYVNPCLPVPLT
ncbi:SH3 domain-containing protein [Streptomyces microflavus]